MVPNRSPSPTRSALHAAFWLLALCVLQPGAARAADDAPQVRPCPRDVQVPATCYSGQDGAGAFYWIAIPKQWNKVLVMHTHGGPADAGPAKAQRSEEDLQRWALMPNLGFAWAGSTYRRGGYGVNMAAQDTERLRQIFVSHFGQPRRTVLHGQSYGGGVAAKTAELYATVDQQRGPYDGVLLTNGVLGGGVLAYQFRADLRQAYQNVCHNHPLPTEPPYPLWTGLPLDSTLTRAELARRVQACTGLGLPMAERSEVQKANLATIARAGKIRPSALLSHLTWATWLFQDLVQRQLNGRNPFQPDADAQAVAALDRDSAPTGQVNVPVLTVHAIDDPTAFVELESVYRAALEKAGTAGQLVQTFTAEDEHSYLNDTEYAALMVSLLDWLDNGNKPTPQAVAARCKALEPTHGASCQFRPDYQVLPLAERVGVRKGGRSE
jgi:pimeloyl-ACP methyl ester carboxylesterase